MNSLSNNDTDVLIAGAGPTGLTLACELRRRGVACRIVDKYAEFPIASRATNIHARTLEVFDDMGVVDSIIALAAKFVGATYLRGGRVVLCHVLRLGASSEASAGHLRRFCQRCSSYTPGVFGEVCSLSSGNYSAPPTL